MHMPALDFKDPGREPIDKVTIVRNHDHGSVEPGNGLQQNILSAQVEVVRRLIQ